MDSRKFEDMKINVKLKISALWVAVMFIYAYADIKSLFIPGFIDLIRAGEVFGGIKITQELWLGAAVLMTIPSVMVFLSLILKPKVNRWTNIILGIVYTVVNIANLLSIEEPWAFFIFYNIVEAVLTLLIAWYAWKWPNQEGQPKQI